MFTLLYVNFVYVYFFIVRFYEFFYMRKEVVLEQSNVTQTILNTINYIFETLLSSIDNRLYGILDDLTFVSSDILHDNYFFENFWYFYFKWNFINCKFFITCYFIIFCN